MKKLFFILILISTQASAQFYYNVSGSCTVFKGDVLPGIETGIGYTFGAHTVALYNAGGKGHIKLLGVQYNANVKAGKKSYLYGTFTVLPYNSFITASKVGRENVVLKTVAVSYGAGFRYRALNVCCKLTTYYFSRHK